MRNQRLLLRLDDAAQKMDIEKWQRMENLLDEYHIKPLTGVIPDCQDPMMEKYPRNELFWDKVHTWMDKGWSIALHGYRHVYDSQNGGINPVKDRSEFAGHSYEIQAERIGKGMGILKANGIRPKIFFAPGHTFDEDTLKALETQSNIRIISDTIAWDVYQRGRFTFIPQQSGKVRKLPFATITYCYHPNTMEESAFLELENFLKKYSRLFCGMEEISNTRRQYSTVDRILHVAYFLRRRPDK